MGGEGNSSGVEGPSSLTRPEMQVLDTWPLFLQPQWQRGGSDPNEEGDGVCGHVTFFRNCPPSLFPSLSSFPLPLQRGQEGRVATEWKAPWSAEEA